MAARLHHREAGRSDGPVVVLGTSLGTTTAMWEPQLDELGKRFRVVVVDHRGHGGSEVVPGPAEIADLGGDVVALLDGLGIEACSWAGVSLGGMVGMWLAAHHPARIEATALVCTAAHLPPPQAWHDRAATVRAEGMAGVADPVVARWFTPGFAEREPAVVDAHRAMLLGTSAEGYAACCEAIATLDLRDALPAITAPTLVISAAQDQATPPPFGEAIAGAVPGARLEVIPDAAHLANVEQPAVVTKLLADHLGGG
ncbi:MAG TPA: 3-oxoadipate enol-lactonase [Acidimicrobiales bacterium]|jgi:3-oxoadipate enol-lactonase|nr:3-oxoadipate enol-lactonase [Acidimicrobiales bacterium]